MSGDLPNLLVAVERAASEASYAEVPALLGELERVRATLWARLMAPQTPQGPAPASKGDQLLLTVPTVAVRLAVRPARVYEMIRRNQMPVVRLGKHVRVPASGLQTWLEQREQKPVGGDLYLRYSSENSRGQRERRNAQANPKATQAHTGGSRPAAGRKAKHRRTVGAK